MKQLAFMIVQTLFGTAGVYLISPFCGVFVYYLFAVLRPQFMWQWSLPEAVNWSLYVALATIGGAVACLIGVLKADRRPGMIERQDHRLNGADCAVLVFGVWILITCLTARNFDVAWIWFIEYLKIFLIYAVSAYLIRSVRQVWRLAVMIASVLGYIAYEINYQYFINHYLGIYHNGYGGLDNNGAGLMLAMGVPLCWFVYEGTSRWWRWVYLLLIPNIVHAVLMTYSRGAMVSLIVVVPWLWWRSRRKLGVSIALLSFGLIAVPMMAGPEIAARFLTIQDSDVDMSANSRRASWKAAWEMAKDAPVFGVGVRNANLFSRVYGADMDGDDPQSVLPDPRGQRIHRPCFVFANVRHGLVASAPLPTDPQWP